MNIVDHGHCTKCNGEISAASQIRKVWIHCLLIPQSSSEDHGTCSPTPPTSGFYIHNMSRERIPDVSLERRSPAKGNCDSGASFQLPHDEHLKPRLHNDSSVGSTAGRLRVRTNVLACISSSLERTDAFSPQSGHALGKPFSHPPIMT